MLYLLIILLFGIFPAAVFLWLARNVIHWKTFFVAEAFIFIVAVISDYIGIQAEVWTYGTGKILGIGLFGIPLEDYIFFLLIPAWVIGCYEFLKSNSG